MSEHDATMLTGCRRRRAGLRARIAAFSACMLLGLVGSPGCVGPGLEPPESDSSGNPGLGGDDFGSGDAGVNGGVGAAGTGGAPTSGASGASGGGGRGASGSGGNGGTLSEPPLDGGVLDGSIDEDAGALR